MSFSFLPKPKRTIVDAGLGIEFDPICNRSFLPYPKACWGLLFKKGSSDSNQLKLLGSGLQSQCMIRTGIFCFLIKGRFSGRIGREGGEERI